MMRMFAWCAITQATSSLVRPLASSAAFDAAAMLRTACL